MARVAPKSHIKQWYPPSKKFVKKANSWCITRWVDGKQIIEWFQEEPNLEELKNEYTI